jgi:acyl transferase domain-containing protein
MGRELRSSEPVFDAKLAEIDALTQKLGGLSVIEQFDGSRLDDTEIAQPCIVAYAIALVALWKSWGVEPIGVAGHSVGEIAAAHVAGVFDLETAMRLAIERGRIVHEAPSTGRMLQVALPLSSALELTFDRKLSIAAHNGPEDCVISGEEGDIEAVRAQLEARNVPVRPVAVRYAFHSAHMDPLAAELERRIANLCTKEPTLPMASTLTGAMETTFDSAYWSRQLRERVRFVDAVETLVERCDTFVEIGPHTVLSASLLATLFGRTENVVPSTRRHAERRTMLEAASGLFVRGTELNWEGILRKKGRCVSLPTYPWQRERMWLIEPQTSTPTAVEGHPLLGRHVALAGVEGHHVWEVDLDERRLPYLLQHRLQGTAIFPGAAYIEIALGAAKQVFGDGCLLRNVEFRRALRLTEGEPARVQVSISRISSTRAQLRIYHADHEEWVLHSSAEIEHQPPETAVTTSI